MGDFSVALISGNLDPILAFPCGLACDFGDLWLFFGFPALPATPFGRNPSYSRPKGPVLGPICEFPSDLCMLCSYPFFVAPVDAPFLLPLFLICEPFFLLDCSIL